MSVTDDIPRWARDLGEETWERINQLLYDGWEITDILRELSVPDSKKRSLQIYAQKFGPRRRLRMFDRFKDALLKGAVDMGPEFAKAMSLIATYAVNPNVDPKRQENACELMDRFARTIMRLMRVDEVADRERQRDEDRRDDPVSANDAVRQILEKYGVDTGNG